MGFSDEEKVLFLFLLFLFLFYFFGLTQNWDVMKTQTDSKKAVSLSLGKQIRNLSVAGCKRG